MQEEPGTGIVLTVGQETVYGGLTPSVEARKQGFDRGANSIAWVLIRFMTVLVPVVFLASGLTKGDWLEAFLFALSVAVGITPELLPGWWSTPVWQKAVIRWERNRQS